MTGNRPPITFLCNGASLAGELGEEHAVSLDYRTTEASNANVHLGLPDFVRNVYHLPPRILDLLEIAAYVFAADRRTQRGKIHSVEYQG